MIRFLIVAVFLVLYLVLGIPVLAILKLIGKVNKDRCDRWAFGLVQWGFRAILAVSGVDVTVIGLDNVPDEAVLFVGNHRSYFDILLTCVRCRRPTGYVAKKEMLRYPLLRDWMKAIYCTFLDRDNIKEGLKTILEAIEYVKSGISIFIFPEGTRNKGEELSLLPFKGGALKIAEKSGCAIVPVSINNSVNIFEAHMPRIKKTHVVIEYGMPIYPKSMDRQERKHLDKKVQEIIQETILRNASLV